MNVVVRPATPDDAPLLGWCCVMAARSQLKRGWFEIVLRAQSSEVCSGSPGNCATTQVRNEDFCVQFATYLTLAKARSWWHWSLFQVADVDGVPAAALCGFGDESVYYASREAIAEAAARMGIPKAEEEQFWARGAFIVSPATSEDGAWTIENAATRPQYRGHGLVQPLLDKEFEIARKAGFKRAQISFFMGNTPAERAYAKAGFTFAEQKTAPDFAAALGIPGVTRFARDI